MTQMTIITICSSSFKPPEIVKEAQAREQAEREMREAEVPTSLLGHVGTNFGG